MLWIPSNTWREVRGRLLSTNCISKWSLLLAVIFDAVSYNMPIVDAADRDFLWPLRWHHFAGLPITGQRVSNTENVSIWISLAKRFNTRLRSFENACVRAEKNRSVLRIVGKQTGDCSSRTSPIKILPSSENVIMDHSNNLNTTILFQKVPPDDIVFVNDFCLNCHRCIFRQAAPKWLTSWRCAAVNTGHWRATGDPLHSRAACTQPCNVNTQSRAHCSPGARLCEQWGARLCEQ